MDDAGLIAVAWGNKGFRGWLLSRAGDVMDSRDTPAGLAAVRDRDFAGALSENCGDWLDGRGLPVVLSGMVGARNGWVEAPYAPCPVGPADLLRLAMRPELSGHDVFILPGALDRNARGDFDVMRGEELQVIGVGVLRGGADADICIPGTHSKLARLRGGRLAGFRTFVTGELFGLVRNNSLIAALAEGDAYDTDAFSDGVRRGSEEPLSHALFAARANALNGALSPRSVDSYISGVLIGAELAAPVADGIDTVLLASGVLADRYRTALQVLGRRVVEIDARQAAIAGFREVAATLFEAA